MITLSDIIFWKGIFSQHGMFLTWLLDYSIVPYLWNDASNMEQSWNSYRVDDGEKVLMYLIDGTIYTKKEILRISLSNYRPINKIIPKDDFEKLLQHMLYEIEYLKRSMLSNMSIEEEIEFYKGEAAQHTDLAADSIIGDEHLKQELYHAAKQMRISSGETSIHLLVQSGKMGEELLQRVVSGDVHSLMNMFMIIHEVEETLHGEEKLRLLDIDI